MPELYKPENLAATAYQLRYSWTCWPSGRPFPPPAKASLLEDLELLWEQDGIRRLEVRWTSEMIQYTVSTKPHIAPVFITARLKGRLDHALREAGTPVKFSRKLSLRSLGNARRSEIEDYIEQQVPAQRFADPATAELLARFTTVNPAVNLMAATESHSGRYWYNLHLVLRLNRCQPLFNESQLQTISDACIRTASTSGYSISRQSAMPNHLHVGLRGNIEQSPEQIALQFLNGLADSVGQQPIWEFGYYAGTFGEYDMGGVSRAAGGSGST